MSAQNETFFWHDYETSGTDPQRDRPMQFAGIRTDADLNIIEDPVMIYARPADDMLPHPMACLITGITPQIALEKGLSEAEFIARIHAELARPGTCGVGYNSIRFDDEVTRNTLYRNFYDPYAREWQNGCSRWDIIDMLRLTRALRPDGIVWPSYEDGTPSLRLEDLTKANGIEHGSAHDALSDVYATIAMAKLVKERQPKLFDYVIRHRSKLAIQKLIDPQSMKPVLHVSSRYPVEQGNMAVVAPIAVHPTNKNASIVWDLRHDPAPLFELTAEQIKQNLYLPRDQRDENTPKLALKLLHANRCPIVAPANMLRGDEPAKFAIDGDQCRAHLALLRNEPNLREKLMAVYQEDRDAIADPDLQIYSGGFFSNDDKKLIDRVREADEESLYELQLPFQDPRLEEMLLRYKARNFPETLTDEEQLSWEEFRAQKLLKGTGGYLTFEALYAELNRIAELPETTAEQRAILEDIALYAESIYPFEP
ncbi:MULTISPECIES: exodeoxyribonuclease I [unclassified Marinobacterium]|uniref:exodeoxyribonuclease I n=1 Tax=unclassified Marinobacterium TaxID=2644139 RepID=UPI0015695C24|nr:MULTISPECIES: exodeoxyribonuclease I [unclassified Marinobacterium]NRP26714.1 Exodeoxyribonuclease I [Marinobacterium sp. xm-d-420]NRP56455.1 Exodeoxyribonuclease I [Marinobacterium sp. xm-d-510]NRP96756.1 Exodeoxyribonuclease I [Marinobacterium sp. xm-a-127]